jgi:hypothetical protein
LEGDTRSLEIRALEGMLRGREYVVWNGVPAITTPYAIRPELAEFNFFLPPGEPVDKETCE